MSVLFPPVSEKKPEQLETFPAFATGHVLLLRIPNSDRLSQLATEAIALIRTSFQFTLFYSCSQTRSSVPTRLSFLHLVKNLPSLPFIIFLKSF